MALLEIKNVTRRFSLGQTELEVLKGLSMQVQSGTFNLLLGPSGSGKTTLLNILGTLDDPNEGQVLFEGDDITSMPERDKDELRRKQLGYIFQSVALMSNMTAYENVDFFLRINGYDRKERPQRIKDVMKFVGLDKRMTHYPAQMSGGEQQRVAIARSISHKPKLILADEPTAELDTATGLKVVSLFKDMIQQKGATVIMCTHDRSLMEFADHIFEMEDGVIISVR